MNQIYEEKKSLVVNNPVAKEQSSMNIVANQNNYYGDDPLQNAYISVGKIKNKDLLEKKYKLIIHLIRKDSLKSIIESKMVDRELVYKQIFERINNYIEGNVNEELIIDNIIDDGYNSIINSIVGIAIILQEFDAESNRILINGNQNIFCDVSLTTLNIKYSDDIENRRQFIEIEKFSKELEQKLRKITSIDNFYNIYNFNQVQINNLQLSNLKFINNEIKYRVTTGIIPNLIKPLYGDNPECGARELIQNATDACKERRVKAEIKKENYKPKIHIKFDDEYITIHDNGIGMDADIIRDHYFYVGNSTKSQCMGNLVGQFGIGSLASFLLGDEIFVRTRRYGQDNILEFNYVLSKDTDKIIEVFIKQEIDFDVGTEIIIKLNENLKNKSRQLETILKLKDWYITSEIPIYLNDNQIETIDKNNSEWIVFKRESSEFVAEFLYDKKDLSSKLNLDRRIIYNGILLSETYNINNIFTYHPVNMKIIPCINILDTGSNKRMKINLERSKFTNLQYIMHDLATEIYKKELNNLKLNTPMLIDKNEAIWRFKYDGQLVDGIPIIYSSMGAALDCVYTRCALHNNGIKKLVILYNCNNISFNDLDKEYAYIFVNRNISKAFIGDKLLDINAKSVYVYSNFIETYFFQADNWSNGLKTNALKEIYNHYSDYLVMDNSLSPTKFWEQHNIQKNSLKDIIMKDNGKGFCKIKEQEAIKSSLIEKIFATSKNAVVECQDTVITDIVDCGDSFDYYYNDIFFDSLFIWQWSEIS